MTGNAARALYLIAATLLFAGSVWAQIDSEKVFYTFTGGSDGGVPGNILFDAEGNLYGVATSGADGSAGCGFLRAEGCGVVFKLSPGAGGAWTETVLYSFTGQADGGNPYTLAGFDSKGNLYGTALHGGDTTGTNCLGQVAATPSGCGVVFELTPTSSGPWKETVIYTFTGGNDGWSPFGATFDSAGNLYGEATEGGANGYGVVYKLTLAASGPWPITELYSFSGGADGRAPSGGLTFDGSGNLFGTTNFGGDTTATCFGQSTPDGCGVVFELTPTSSGPWKESVLYIFTGASDGGVPTSGVILDSQGNVYGAAAGGGSTRCYYGCGVIFKLTPASTTPWAQTILHTFTAGLNADGGGAYNPLIFRDGNLYGSTSNGGLINSGNCRTPSEIYGCGSVFELTPAASGPWNQTILYTFAGGADGATPEEPLVFDAAGNIYSTVYSGGNLLDCSTSVSGPGCGLVFKLPTGTASSVTLASSTNPSVFGQLITLTASVSPSGPPTPTGTMTFTADGLFLAGCSVFPLSASGMAQCTTTALTAGTNNLRALYSGDSTYASSFGSLSQVVNSSSNTASTTTLTTSVNPSLTGQSVTFTATVSPSGSPAPTGTVEFVANNAPISGCAAVKLSSSGSATCATTTLAPGADAIVAAYSGDSHYTASGSWLTQTANASAVPLEFVPVAPCRLVDTRNSDGAFGGPAITGGSFRSFSIPQGACFIPDTALAYSLNVTAIPEGTLAYLTAWPAGEGQPAVSTLNSLDGRTKADAVIIPAGSPFGEVNVYVTNTANVLLDINGFFQPAGTSTLRFYPLTPCRVADTRKSSGYASGLGSPSLAALTERDFPILAANSNAKPCNIPSSAKAYSLNFTVVPPSGGEVGYLTVWPQGESRPTVSTLNDPTGTIVANAALVTSGSSGGVAAYADQPTDLLIDINGYFATPGGAGALSLYPVAPCRVLDTRKTTGEFSGALTVDVASSACEPPSTAQGYVFNATVVPSGDLGYLTLWPDGESQPVVSTLNAADGAITSNLAIVPNTDGKTDAYASGTTQLVLDISAYFAP